MTITVLQAAKYLCERSGWAYSSLELQKIIYICHMLYLGREGEPLVEGDFQARKYGPVHPELYERLKYFGASSIRDFAFRDIEDLNSSVDEKEISVLEEGFESFSPSSGEELGAQLIAITHWKKGAWKKKYKPEAKHIKISNNDIQQEYRNYQVSNRG